MDHSLQPIFEGWREHQRLLVGALRDLTPDQVALRTAPHQWAVWQLAAHIAGSRAYWFHDQLGEGDRAVRDLFRMGRTTLPGLPLDDAGWEDDEDHPRTAAELVDALTRTWDLVDQCLRRWTPDDLAASVEAPKRAHHRAWVVWHVLEHDVHHGGEIGQILGSHGLSALDM